MIRHISALSSCYTVRVVFFCVCFSRIGSDGPFPFSAASVWTGNSLFAHRPQEAVLNEPEKCYKSAIKVRIGSAYGV